MGNYRPVTIYSVFSELYAYTPRLQEYLNKNNILTNNQFGFREGTSTCDAIHLFRRNVVNDVDEEKCAKGVFLQPEQCV